MDTSMARKIRLPRQAWAAIAWRTARHVAFAVVFSVAVSFVLLETFSQGIGDIGLLVAIVAPLVLGGPMVFYMSMRQAELQLAYERLEAAAARDSLTNCLNHGAFVDAVTGALENAAGRAGALLVVDADHFKSINDRFGHASGDTALKLIVAAIRTSMGGADIIGRLGGEEFGVFLPGADAIMARHTAEAIRQSVQMIEFDAGEQGCTLSVSVGGAVTNHAIGFSQLFRSADQRLYGVKDAGRNNIDIVVMPAQPLDAANAAPRTTPTVLDRRQKVRRRA